MNELKAFALKDAAGWQKSVDANTDPYGRAVIEYAACWAHLMEEQIQAGVTLLDDMADKMSHEADTDGITGFMYGAAVSILSQVWVYGEQLRRWHNLKTQSGTEGEKANASGGVLNPALLRIG